MNFKSQIGKLGKLAGLILIVLLVVASGAQADGEWKIAEQTMTDLEAPEASIFGTATESFKLAIAWYASEIECTTLATEAPTKIFQGGTSEAILKLSSCQILGPPFVAKTCELIEPIELKVAGKLLLHDGKTYELFETPSGKTSLGAVKFKEGTECPLPLSNELKGTFVGETEAGERKEQPLTFNSTVEALFGSDALSFGAHPASLKGKSIWALAAGYKGLKWAALGKETEEEELETKALEEEELEAKALEEEELEAKELECKRESSGLSWYICGNPLEEPESFDISLDSFVLNWPGGGLDLLYCEAGFAKASQLEKGGKQTGELVLEGCKTEVEGEEGKEGGGISAVCEPDNQITLSLASQLKLSSGKAVLQFAQSPLLNFKIIGEECPITGEYPVKGSIVVECPGCETESVDQSFGITESELSWSFEELEASGIFKETLGGENKGKKWGGDPE